MNKIRVMSNHQNRVRKVVIIALFIMLIFITLSFLSLQAAQLNSISTITGSATNEQFGFAVTWYGNLN
ncbi:MAG: hypothetical protein QMC98_04655, partial [Candidatus Thermoplasmatota archaeon]|nr:hypothetical protein [Candidatus Thermoplasmatota archaeon]